MEFLPDKIITEFFNTHISENIFSIAQGGTTSLIVIVTTTKIETIINSPELQKLKADYYKLIRKHTKIKISKPENIILTLISKEEFDLKYQGSWYNLFR